MPSAKEMRDVLGMGKGSAPAAEPASESPAPAADFADMQAQAAGLSETPPAQAEEATPPAQETHTETVQATEQVQADSGEAREMKLASEEPAATDKPIAVEIQPDKPLDVQAQQVSALPADEKDKLIERLLAQNEQLLNRISGAPAKQEAQPQQPAQQVQQQADPQEIELISEEELDGFITDHKQANKFLAKFAQQIRNQFMRESGPLINHQVSTASIINRFLDANEDFQEPAKLREVNFLANDIASEHPEYDTRKVFREVERQMRTRYPKQVQQPAQVKTVTPNGSQFANGDVDRRPNFARSGGGARSSAPAPKKNSLADEIKAVING